MLGGGNFTFKNKVLPGAYINFKSKSKASVDFAERGYVGVALKLKWGLENTVITIENADFQKKSLEILGYSFDAPEMQPLRELFINAKTVYLYRLSKNTVKATNKYATALYGGSRGNDLSIKIENNVDKGGYYNVYTLLDEKVVDLQVVQTKDELVPNKYVTFKTTDNLEVTTVKLGGGTDGDNVTGTEYQAFLDAIESYYINTLTTTTNESSVKKLFVSFTKRMRDEIGVKFQTVLYRESADYEGIVNLENKVLDEGVDEASGVLWVAGALAGCEINKSLTNRKYDGEYTFETKENQTALINGKLAGKLLLHKVGDDIRVLSDINSFVTVTKEKNKDFTKNQTIRILDQVAVDIASLFNKKYLGIMPNDDMGRIELWKDIVLHHETLQNIRALENFKSTDIVITRGEEKDQVVIIDVITPVNAMEQVYMDVIIG